MSGDDEQERGSEFRRAARDVKRLPRGGRRPEPTPRLEPRAAAAEAPARFEIERAGERMAGRAAGADRKLLRRLARGQIAPERELDLHGLDAAAAERALRAALAAALEAGERCLLVIHGRGRRSEAGPVLREALPAWLAAPPHGRRILAFASADPGHGGPGASYVLLRRKG